MKGKLRLFDNSRGGGQWTVNPGDNPQLCRAPWPVLWECLRARHHLQLRKGKFSNLTVVNLSLLHRPILSWTSIYWLGKFKTLLRKVFLTLSDFKILSKKRRHLRVYLKMLDLDKFVQNFNSNKFCLPRKLISCGSSYLNKIWRLSLQRSTDVLFKWTVYNTREITKAYLSNSLNTDSYEF